ncbi:MAG: hypothetical protein JWO30_2246 [Fibrobacteres bacterium]|nr:hypothetical protein [Fibrobacterota bacterium]
MEHRSLFLIVALLASLGYPQSDATGDGAKARAAVEANLKGKDGSEFAKTALASFAKTHAGALKICRDTVKAPDTSRFDILFMLSRRGMVKDALLSPVTNVGQCLLRESANEVFPPPPGPNHWILIRSADIRD